MLNIVWIFVCLFSFPCPSHWVLFDVFKLFLKPTNVYIKTIKSRNKDTKLKSKHTSNTRVHSRFLINFMLVTFLLVFCALLFKSLSVLLSFYICPVYCLAYFDPRPLIILWHLQTFLDVSLARGLCILLTNSCLRKVRRCERVNQNSQLA